MLCRIASTFLPFPCHLAKHAWVRDDAYLYLFFSIFHLINYYRSGPSPGKYVEISLHPITIHLFGRQSSNDILVIKFLILLKLSVFSTSVSLVDF